MTKKRKASTLTANDRKEELSTKAPSLEKGTIHTKENGVKKRRRNSSALDKTEQVASDDVSQDKANERIDTDDATSSSLTAWNKTSGKQEPTANDDSNIKWQKVTYKRSKSRKLGKYVAMDCEMVGVGDGRTSVLARVSVVNYDGAVLLDKYVKPLEEVTDYRTWVSGIEPKHLKNGHDFKDVQREVAGIIQGRVVIGHALKNDFQVLMFDHPRKLIRDTSLYAPFRVYAKGKAPSLKRLASEEFGLDIQSGPHSSVEDAKTCMLLFRKHKVEWERSIFAKTQRQTPLPKPPRKLNGAELYNQRVERVIKAEHKAKSQRRPL